MLDPAAAPLPDLVVRTLPDRARRLRRVELVFRWLQVLCFVAVGFSMLALGILQSRSASSSETGTLFDPLSSLPIQFGAGIFLFAGYLIAVITLRPEYWKGRDVPEVAFTLGRHGVELSLPQGVDLGLPAGTTTVTVPWASVTAVRRQKRLLVFSVASGVLPTRMRDTARYGLPVLDQESATILTAAAALREGRMPGVSAN